MAIFSQRYHIQAPTLLFPWSNRNQYSQTKSSSTITFFRCYDLFYISFYLYQMIDTWLLSLEFLILNGFNAYLCAGEWPSQKSTFVITGQRSKDNASTCYYLTQWMSYVQRNHPESCIERNMEREEWGGRELSRTLLLTVEQNAPHPSASGTYQHSNWIEAPGERVCALHRLGFVKKILYNRVISLLKISKCMRLNCEIFESTIV